MIKAPMAEVYAVARTYLLAVHHDSFTPTIVVQREHHMSRSRAAHRLRIARSMGLLPYAGQGRRVFGEGHWPRCAQWCTSGGRHRAIWTACQECHELWPCPDAATLYWLRRLDEAERGTG